MIYSVNIVCLNCLKISQKTWVRPLDKPSQFLSELPEEDVLNIGICHGIVLILFV